MSEVRADDAGPNSIIINVDGEARSYDLDTLSDEAKNKIAGMQFYNNTISPIVGEIVRLLQMGAGVNQGQLQALLPKKYDVVVQDDENPVKSKADNKNGDIIVPS
ncbi:MAG: hypothetical protein ACR2PE_03425 [Porticoccus sp.]